MLVPVQGSPETLRHICDGKNTAWVKAQAPVFIHDVHAYMSTCDNALGIQNIKFCPYCGVIVDNDR